MSGRARNVTTPAVVVLLTALALTGCSSASPPSPPSGVDGLTIPTPDPRQSDFVDVIDNPWLPLAVGASWTYRDAASSSSSLTRVVEVGEGPVVDDVGTVRVTGSIQGASSGAGQLARIPDDYYAQDRDGNVWWFGREGEWMAGIDGAEAGLAMPATPRVGDGFRQAGSPGLARVAEVRGFADQVEAEGQLYARAVVLQVSVGSQVEEETYARGTGLVQRTGPDGALGLLEHQEPQS